MKNQKHKHKKMDKLRQVATSISINSSLLDEIDKYCESRKISRSGGIEKLVKIGLDLTSPRERVSAHLEEIINRNKALKNHEVTDEREIKKAHNQIRTSVNVIKKNLMKI